MRAAAPASFTAILCVACSSSPSAECDCADPTVVLTVPDARASAVVDVALSGPACNGVTATCATTGDAGSCVRFRFTAVAAGGCHVDVDFSSGPARFSADVTMVPGRCCKGFYASPPSAAAIEVPLATLRRHGRDGANAAQAGWEGMA